MLKLIDNTLATRVRLSAEQNIKFTEALNHHFALLESYFQSHRIRNHSEKTIQRERAFLMAWFEEHGSKTRPLYTWEAMTPQIGRERVVEYAKALKESQLTSDTVRSYLGILRNYFSFVLEHPFVKNVSGFIRIHSLYGTIDQPISEYDMPVHVYDDERKGTPFDPERLYEFYAIIRKHYLDKACQAKAIAARK